MTQHQTVKRCPLRMAMNPLGSWPAWECIAGQCAWWTGQECAIARIAAGLQLSMHDPHEPIPIYVADLAKPAQQKEGQVNGCETCTYNDECESSDSLEVRCAWCGKPLGSKPGEGTSGVTHGICDDCAARLFAGLEEFMKEKEDDNG
jgi:hypothetical protein